MDTEHKSAGEARDQLAKLLDDAERGKSTVITRDGKPVAALVPIKDYRPAPRQESLVALRGSGRGLWGDDSRETIRKLRDEWDR